MKTTIDIPDPLLKDIRALASREETTLKALVSEGLREVLRTRQKEKGRKPFKLPDLSVDGNGLQPHLNPDDWGSIRDLIYPVREGLGPVKDEDEGVQQ